MRTSHPLVDFYRCSEATLTGLKSKIGEAGVVCGLQLPADLSERLDFLRLERYCQHLRVDSANPLATDALRRIYYRVRPLLPDQLRRAFQRLYLSDWRKLKFPRWPVDTTVEDELEAGLLLAMRDSGVSEVPFIWFWPHGADGAVMLTHDVETQSGLDFVSSLMEIDDEYGFKSAYQLVPEDRYRVSSSLIEAINARGCESNVHGLDHNANLFDDFSSYLTKASRINKYIQAFVSKGFRSPCMYRNAGWLKYLEIQYDMSVPNVAHMEPQRGGCCTVFPFFIGSILELPLTTIQDYSLFHILKHFSIDMWRQQVEMILSRHGLASFIVHPDYLRTAAALQVYRRLLEWLRECCGTRNLWAATPGEVNAWWRMRDQMTLLNRNGIWEIAGTGSERARVAFAAARDGGGIEYRVAGVRHSPEAARESSLL